MMTEEIENMELSKIKEMSNEMQKSATELYKLLENLLEWSRMQRGLIKFNPDICVLHFLAKQNIRFLSEFAKQKNIEIINQIQSESQAMADIQMLNTVFRNLISNAIKFTYRGGKVVISVEEKEDQVVVFIRDSGIGMSEETIRKLFRIDQKVFHLGTEGESSSGLGLILCKEFITKNGGEIWAESELGKGSTFCFTLNKSNWKHK